MHAWVPQKVAVAIAMCIDYFICNVSKSHLIHVATSIYYSLSYSLRLKGGGL